ncbi:MAG: hypothetical protein K8T10_20065 [Candidatus Eremiobacteraeota bacterium]|nr:hypothetical protein [Candidatus Eremiobacteraeota bacterium]
MGMMDRIVNSKFGKAVKWTALGTSLIGAAGVGQQYMNYDASKDRQADTFEMVQTDVDGPSVTQLKKQFEYSTDVSPLAEGPEQDKAASSKTGTVTVKRAATSSAGEDAEVKIPAKTFQRVIAQIEETPEAQEKMAAVISKVDTQVEGQIETGNRIKGGHLALVRVPMPTGDDPIFNLKVPNVLSGDFYSSPMESNNWTTINPTGTKLGSIQEEELPIAISYDLEQAAPNVKVQSKLIKPDKTPAPPSTDKPYILLAGIRTSVTPEESTMNIKGRIGVSLDVDGTSTQKKIDQLKQVMQNSNSSSDQIKRASQQFVMLQNRMKKSGQLRGRMDKTGSTHLIEQVMKDQTNSVEMPVRMNKDKPLAEATHYFWLGPDKDADGKADIYITQEIDLSGMDNISPGRMKMKAPSHKDVDGKLLRIGNELVEKTIQKETRKAVRSMESSIRNNVKEAMRKKTADTLPDIEQIASQKLAEVLRKNGQFSTNVEEEGFNKNITASLTGLQVVEHGGKAHAVLRLDTDGKATGQADFISHLEATNQAVNADSAMVTLDGRMLNEMLKDQKDGGAVNWNQILKSVKESDMVKDVVFNQDANGNTVYPRLIMQDGKPVINIDMSVYLAGAGPVESGTGIIKAGTGIVDEGAKIVTEGTLGQLGEAGEIAGKVIRSPFWLLDQIVGGAKTVIDSTVGAVVDAVPKAVTDAKINVNMSIPVNLSVKNGSLHLEASPRGLKMKTARFGTEQTKEDILPLNLLISAVAQGIVEDSPDAVVGQDKPFLEKEISLQKKGLDFKNVEISGTMKDKYKDDVPIFNVEVSPNANIAGVISEAIGK